MPPRPRKGTLAGVVPETGNSLLNEDEQSAPVSPFYEAGWNSDRGQPAQLAAPRPEEGSPEAVPDGGTGFAPLNRFAYSPDNPRDDDELDIDADEELKAMGETVEEYGVLTPITVVARTQWITHHPEHDDLIDADAWWVVLMGGTRLLLARAKGLEGLAFARNDALATPVKAIEGRLIENRRRRNLNPIQEALQFQALTKEHRVSQREVARRTGYSPATITQRLKLLKLIPDFQKLVRTGQLAEDKAYPLSDLTDEQQRALWDLGAPYSPSRLPSPDTEEAAGKAKPDLSRSIRVPVKLSADSTPEDVVKTLVAKLDANVLKEISRVLADALAAPKEP